MNQPTDGPTNPQTAHIEMLLMIYIDFFSNFMPFPLKIRDSKKTRNGPTPRTDRRTDPHIEMRGRI